MEKNIYNLTETSKNQLEKSKKIQKNTAEYLRQYEQNLKEATTLKEAQELEAAMSAARFSNASVYARSKNRINKLNEEIQYNENSSLIGMTEMIAQVVESALLLDEAEFAELNPNYKNDIRDTVYNLLKEAEINEVISNRETLSIMEYVAVQTPGVREGVTLTEDELSNYISSNKPKNIDKSIKKLSENVSSKVAQLMEKEQAKAAKIEEDVAKAKGEQPVEEVPAEGQEMVEPSAEEIVEALYNGELTQEDVEAMVQNGEISEETYNQIDAMMSEEGEEQPEEVPAEEGMEDQAPAGRSIHIDPNGTTSISMPNGQLALNGDGSMDIQLMEDNLNLLFDDSDVLYEENINVRHGLVDKEVDLATGDAIVTRKKYDPEYILGKQIGLKSAVIKPLLLSLIPIPYVGLAIGSIVHLKNSANNKHLLRSEAYADLKKAVEADSGCKNVAEKIKRELLLKEPNKDHLKTLKFEFINNVNRVRDDLYKKKEQLKENRLVRETPRCGLIESLAVNEAQNRLNAGESYNPDLCLANAIMYVTITETMNEMGLMNIGDTEYTQIISAAGGNINEARGYLKRNMSRNSMPKDIKRITDIDYLDRKFAYEYGKKASKLYSQAAQYHNSGDDYMARTSVEKADGLVARGKKNKRQAKYLNDLESGKPLDQLQKQSETEPKVEPKKKGLFGKKKVLAEASVTQWGVQMNTSNGDDLAERIRQKRLNEQSNQTLHD